MEIRIDFLSLDGTVTTTTTTKPLYPTLHPRDFPTAPFDPYPNYDFGQRQGLCFSVRRIKKDTRY